jgi:hypothetical protein
MNTRQLMDRRRLTPVSRKKVHLYVNAALWMEAHFYVDNCLRVGKNATWFPEAV